MSTNYISQITATDGVTYDVQEGVTTRIFRATCTTAASTAAKVATLDDNTGYSLTTGVRVAVTFTNGNTATSPTLNVNSGGAKNIYYRTSTSAAQKVDELCVWGANETVIFTYNGSSWIMMGSSLALYNAYNKAASSGSGTITEVKTNEGAHTTIDVLSGKAEFNVPTKTSHLTNDSGFIINQYKGTEVNNAYVYLRGESFTDGGSYTIGFKTPQGSEHPQIRTILHNDTRKYQTEIYDLITPVNDTDAANKKYVDDSINAITIPTKTSDLTNDSGFITGYTETDPTVPSWAKASTKPTYTYTEVGAAATSHSHGNITSGGDITATAPTIASGDQIIINDNSASKITNGPTFDGSTTTKALTPKGTWETFSNTDNKVLQTGIDVLNPPNDFYPILFSESGSSETSTEGTKKSNYLRYNPYSNELSLAGSGTIDATTLSASQVIGSNFILGNEYSNTLTASDTTADRSYNLPDKSGTIALTSDIPSVPTITLNGTSTTSASFYAPTSAGTNGYVLKSNGSGAPTWVSATLTDTKLQVEDLTTNYNSSVTHRVVLRGNGTSASTGYISNIYFSHVGGSTSSQGYANLILGNETATGTNGNSTGRLVLYASNNKSTQIDTNTLTDNNIITLPSGNGTLALTSDIPTETTVSGWGFTKNTGTLTGVTFAGTSMSVSSGVASITQANARTALGLATVATSGSYDDLSNKPTIPANTDEKVKLTSLTGTTAVPLVLGPTSITSGTAYNCLYNTNLNYTPSTGNLHTTQLNGVTVGSSPKFTDSEVSTLTLASGNTSGTSLSFGGKYTLTAGSKTVSFTMPSSPTVPTITLNGTSTTSASFYAPTTVGTSGQFLKSSGSGAPSWSTLAATDIPTLAQTKISANSASIEFDYTGDSYTTNSLSDVTNALIDEIDATQTAMENITAMVNSKPNIKITRW